MRLYLDEGLLANHLEDVQLLGMDKQKHVYNFTWKLVHVLQQANIPIFKTFLPICLINIILIFYLKSEFSMHNLVSEAHRQITEGNQDKSYESIITMFSNTVFSQLSRNHEWFSHSNTQKLQ